MYEIDSEIWQEPEESPEMVFVRLSIEPRRDEAGVMSLLVSRLRSTR